MPHQGKWGLLLCREMEMLMLGEFRYCIKTLSGHLDWVRSVSPSEDGRYLLTASNDQVGFGISHLCVCVYVLNQRC